MRFAILFFIGVVFGLGLSVSGMINPAKVLNFFDIAGNWDASLAFVMGGALLVALPGYQWIFRRGRPIIDVAFDLPLKRAIDGRLILGAAIFGVGWGLVGLCPGPALSGLGTGSVDILIFVIALVGGILLNRLAMRFLAEAKQ